MSLSSFNYSISEEQKKIVKYSKRNYNVIIDSIAGSGKTSTILFITVNNQNKKILLLTYNARLKLETRKKIELLELNNIEAHSYHSFAKQFYEMEGYTDKDLLDVLSKNNKPIKKLTFDMLILDEVQDMTKIYYDIVTKKIIKEINTIQIILLGDIKQCIYQYNGSDFRYLSLANKLFREKFNIPKKN